MAEVLTDQRRALVDYVEAARRRPWEWGQHDCTMFASGWIERATGIDPAAEWRGTYRTQREMQIKVMRAGGLRRIVTAQMERHGFAEIVTPASGDVGIVRAPVDTPGGLRFREIGAVRMGEWWICLGLAGIVGAPLEMVRGWRVSPRAPGSDPASASASGSGA